MQKVLVVKAKPKIEQLLIDGDILIYKNTSAAENEIHWGNDFWTLHADFQEVKTMIDSELGNLQRDSGVNEVSICFSSPNNFRKKIFKEYKQHRSGIRKPLCFNNAKDYVREKYDAFESDWLEADDLLGVKNTMFPDHCCIVSVDKDLLTVPGYHWDFEKKEVFYVDEGLADYHFYMQTLTGDATDGYKGCPGVGPVKAKRILDKAIEEDIDMWDAVVDTFIKAKLSRDEAILQARMAYILRKDQYDGLDNYPKLWYPYDEIVETA